MAHSCAPGVAVMPNLSVIGCSSAFELTGARGGVGNQNGLVATSPIGRQSMPDAAMDARIVSKSV